MANEQFNEDIKLEEAINKYGGDDEKYKNTLKKHVRNFLGYSNYVNQMNQMPGIDDPGAKKVMGGGVEDSYLRGDITPAGVRQLTGSGIDLRNQEMGYIQQLAKGANSAAGSSSSKGAGEAFKEASSFEAQDPLDEAIKSYMGNPRNPDGTFKTLDQLKKELEGAPLGEGDIAQWQPEDVEARLAQRLPGDLQDNFQKMYYQSIGYTSTEADNIIKYDRYAKGEMSESEAELYRMTDPTFAAKAEMVQENPGIQSDLDKLQTDDPGALTYKELQNKYPNITPEMVKPQYERAALSDINMMTQEIGLSPITTDEETGQQTVQDWYSFADSETAKGMVNELSTIYQGILTPAEIKYQLYMNYLQQTKGAGING